jgi:hypothetical protein
MSTLLDLFEIARSNAARLREQCPDGAAEFLRVVDEESTVSINLRASALRGFLEAGEYRNRHELPEGKPDFDPCEKAQAAFEAGFHQGASFQYGSLYLRGGEGASYYGNFCLVLRQSWSQDCERLAFLARDSAIYYLKREPNGAMLVHEIRVREDAAVWSERAYLATWKLVESIKLLPAAEWPQALANRRDYIEAIVDSKIRTTDCDRVCIPRKDPLLRLLRASYAKLEPGEESDLQSFKALLKELKGQGIPLDSI